MGMNQVYVGRQLKSARTFLARWQAVDARSIESTRSHTSLSLLLKRAGREGNLYIACLDPSWKTGPVPVAERAIGDQQRH